MTSPGHGLQPRLHPPRKLVVLLQQSVIEVAPNRLLLVASNVDAISVLLHRPLAQICQQIASLPLAAH